MDILNVFELYPPVCEAVTGSRSPTTWAAAQVPTATLVHAVFRLFMDIADFLRRKRSTRQTATGYLALERLQVEHDEISRSRYQRLFVKGARAGRGAAQSRWGLAHT